MLAKVLSRGSVYHSPVFAVSMKHPVKVVVFDSSFTELIVVEVFRTNRYSVLFMNLDAGDFAINDSDFKSYWNDKNIFKTVKRKQYSSQMLEEAKEILRNTSVCEFTKIEKPSDLEALDINTGSFHDGYILGMRQENDTLEILLDTSWSDFIVLKCKGVIENNLELGQIFSYCDMRIGNDCVEFSFDPLSGNPEEEVFIAKQVEFKPLFGIRIDISRFAYEFSNHHLTIKTNEGWVEIDHTHNDILDFHQRGVLGYIENDDIMQRCLIFNNDIVYSFCKYVNNRKQQTKLANKVLTFQNQCKKYGFYFDQFPVYDDFEEFEFDYGELIYTHKYSVGHHLMQLLKIMSPLLLGNNAIWLAIQLSNPQMKWIVYLVAGLGVSLFVALLTFIGFSIGTILNQKNGYSDSKCLEIYENRLKHNGYDTGFDVDYESIVAVEYNKRIIIHTTGIKFKLYKFKDDKAAYEIIKNQFEKSKDNRIN